MGARPSSADLAIGAAGCIATLLAAYLAVTAGAQISVGLAAAVALFLGTVALFMVYPHVAVSATIALFVLVPMLKVFVAPEIGAVKDAVVVAAAVAAIIVFVFERRIVDRWVLILVAIMIALYVINVGSGHGAAWAQGVRLTGEPLILLLVGMILPDPRRTFTWALSTLIAMACVVATYGIFQQLVGKWTLIDWGYSFDVQVRSLGGGQLRSFGTLDDPFAYAAFLLYGLAAVLFRPRRGPVAWGAGTLILIGLMLSFSRTGALIVIAFIGLVLWRRGHAVPAMLAVAAITLTSAVVLVNAEGTKSSTVAVPSAGQKGTAASVNVVLNGRVSAWSAALGDNPSEWLMGRGVGEVGTAAARSGYALAPAEGAATSDAQAVDSGYLATIADVGLVGLAVLLTLFTRLTTDALNSARRGLDEGWFGLAVMATLLIDALTRASFTGFPTAFLGLLLVGVSISAASEQEPMSASSPARP